MDPSYCYEKEMLSKLLKAMKQDPKGKDDISVCLNLCEMTQDWQFAMLALSHHGGAKRFIDML